MAGDRIVVAFDPPPGASPLRESVVELVGAAGLAEVGPPVETDLVMEYFDSTQGSLGEAGVTLVRRSDGEHGGWILALPDVDGAGHADVVVPLRRRSRNPPGQLLDTVRILVRDHPVNSVATLRIHRRLLPLLDQAGRVAGEVRDDAVASDGPSGEQHNWRQWEIALPAGSPGVLDAVRDRFTAAGAGELSEPARLSRILGTAIGAPAPEADFDGEGPAWLVVHRRLAAQVDVVKRLDPRVRRDLPDSVHDLRVALRRLRSALATFRPLLDRDVTDPLRGELKWIAGLLGEARDSEVLRERILAGIAEEPPGLVIGPVARRVEGELRGQYRDALARTVRAMESDRYFALVDGLDALVAHPPWTAAACESADKRLPRRVRHDYQRVRRAVRAVATDDPDSRDRQLHEVRKAAKRARYAAEAVVPLYGRQARRFAKANQRLQTVLGDHNDSVVARRELLQLAGRAREDGEDTFTYGRLHAREQTQARGLQQQFARIWKKASRRKLRRWLD